MNDSDYLDLELKLLLAHFGERAVLRQLASKLGISEGHLIAEINDSLKVSTKPKRRQRSSAPEGALKQVIAAYPEKAENLSLLYNRYENRAFLNSVREVQRFLDLYSSKRIKVDSRSKALPKVLRILAGLNASQLEQLKTERRIASDSALSLISEEILRRS